MISTAQEILEFLKDKKNWIKNLTDKELWTYTDISKTYRIGRQKYDWAIFKNNKNLNFYFADGYGDVPPKLITDLQQLLKDSK